MKKYKVQFSHVFDVLAQSEAHAVELANEALDEAVQNGTLYYNENADPTVYDVTNTDDPFNPLN